MFQTLHPFQKDTADKSSYILRRPQKMYNVKTKRTIVPNFCGLLKKVNFTTYKQEIKVSSPNSRNQTTYS